VLVFPTLESSSICDGNHALKNEQLTKMTPETGNSRSGIVDIKHRLLPP
jgi:hypothetical protein